MKVAFVGKGGSGKTTLSSLLMRYLASQQKPVLAIDADINQHLRDSLGFNEEIPALGSEMGRIKEYFRGTNSRIASSSVMAKTTPPGTGSKLIRYDEQNPVFDYFVREKDGIRLLTTGPFTEEDLGVACYHSKTGAVEMILNHLIDTEAEYIIADMTAGADSFASGLFTRFDLTLVVVEPTIKSVSVYKQYKHYAQDFDVAIRVIGNKVETTEDEAFIKEHIGSEYLASFRHSPYVKSLEKGVMMPIENLEKKNKEVLDGIIIAIDAQKKDWKKFYEQMIYFHKKNALDWANAQYGEDLTKQIDPNFSLEKTVSIS